MSKKIMEFPTQADLTNAIANGARKSFQLLFDEHPGLYYYCALITSGEAPAPRIAAWSKQALAAATNNAKDPEDARWGLKWSYADSPYYCYGEEFFEEVDSLFSKRPQLSVDIPYEQWESEYQLRLDAMEAAMARLDSEGIFGIGNSRLKTVVLVEVMPPDTTNTERALRLNPPEALAEWLNEAAETGD